MNHCSIKSVRWWCFLATVGGFELAKIAASDADDTGYSDPPSNGTNADTDWDSSTLIFTQVLFRGGVHALTVDFPRLKNPFLEGKGTLTKVRFWSSTANNTLKSMQCLAAGLFPPVADHDHWHPNISWVPVPYHIDLKLGVAGSVQAIYAPICKSLRYVIDTPEFKQFGKQNEELIAYLCKEAGLAYDTDALEAVYKIACSLQILSYYPELVPEWANRTVLAQVEAYYYGFLKMISGVYPVQRISAGWLLGDIVNAMLIHLRKYTKRKFMAYTMHDDVFVPLMWLLGEIPERWPAYGSILSIELHKKNGKEYVQLWYWYDVQFPPSRLKVSNCSTDPCTFAEFADLSRHNPGKLWEAECMGELTPSYRDHAIILRHKIRFLENMGL